MCKGLLSRSNTCATMSNWPIGCQPPAKCTTTTSQVVFGSGLCWQHVGHSAKVLTDLYKYLEIGEMSRRLPISRCCVFGLSEVSHCHACQPSSLVCQQWTQSVTELKILVQDYGLRLECRTLSNGTRFCLRPSL